MNIEWKIPDVTSLLSENESKYQTELPDNPWGDHESPYELMKNHNKLLEDQIKPLSELADSAKRQADSAESVANSAKRQADSAGSIASSSKIQADLAVKQSQKADIKSWIAITISVFALLVEFMAYHKDIFSFLSHLFS